MTNDEVTAILARLIADWENEAVESKTAGRQFSAERKLV